MEGLKGFGIGIVIVVIALVVYNAFVAGAVASFRAPAA